MPTTERNRAWGVHTFLDSFVKDLDTWYETLAVKGITRPLTYTIQDVQLELQCFPQFDGNDVRFLTASPGEPGASAIRFQLGSISASSIRDIAPQPVSNDDVVIDNLPDLGPEAKEALVRVGVKTESDLRRVQQRNVDLSTLTGGRIGDYSDLATAIQKVKRARLAPTVRKAKLNRTEEMSRVALEGENLFVDDHDARFPMAAVDGREVAVVEAAPNRIVVDLPRAPTRAQPVRLELALDAYAVMTLELQP